MGGNSEFSLDFVVLSTEHKPSGLLSGDAQSPVESALSESPAPTSTTIFGLPLSRGGAFVDSHPPHCYRRGGHVASSFDSTPVESADTWTQRGRPMRAEFFNPPDLTNPQLRDLLDELTPAERRVLTLLSEGLSTKEIAGELFVSPRTVESHRAQLSRKLDLHSVAGLTRFALKCGLTAL